MLTSCFRVVKKKKEGNLACFCPSLEAEHYGFMVDLEETS